MGMFGLVLALAAVAVAQWWHGGSLLTLLDGPAFVIVVGGTWGAVILQTPRKYMLAALAQARWMLFPPQRDLVQQAERLQAWAQFARQQGLLALENQAEEESDPFTRQGLTMIVDGVSIEDIRRLLEADIDIEQERNEHAARVFEAMGGYSPTIGIIGAVIGLIQAMFHLEEPGTLGAGIAIAFVATIYGVGFANLLYLPIANRLRAFHYHHGLYQEMTLEGLLAIAHGENGQQVERRLRAYLKGE
ncbi:flagellar motor protein [Aeromonas media]|jgi:chemotaxis protein MotA|uniref:Flagellar motor protein n=2 Tax=Aeromonas media TaxID=651 RepID=A0AAW5RKR4_AERME|nr:MULTISPECIES: flagellar motor protein [Aeromonas]MBV7469505.1 flagellar motor protein [Aeromonas sp. sif0611]MCV3289335.1 flagellar motor protein [Aeromonas media]MCY9823810.1 flagellar motor protein [Aeromonas media]MCY9835425.1 flagellar motor protein [Aeromonas media]QQQ12494.1 flagellar motor protein [Aeromonas media]